MKTFDEKYAKPIDPKDVIPEYPKNLIKDIRKYSDIKDATPEEINEHIKSERLQDYERDILRLQYMYDINDDDLAILYVLPLNEIKRVRRMAVRNLAKEINKVREAFRKEEQKRQEIIDTNKFNITSIYNNVLSLTVKQFAAEHHIILDKTADKLQSKGINTVKDLINMSDNDIIKYILDSEELERLAIRICSYNIDWTQFGINNVWPDFLREYNTDYLSDMIEDFKKFELDKEYKIDIEKLEYKNIDIVMTEISDYGRDTIIAHYKYNYEYKELAKLYGGFPEMIKFDHYQFLSYILPRACMYDVLEIWNFKYYSYKRETCCIESHEYPTNLLNDVYKNSYNVIRVLYTIPEQREMADLVINCMDDPYKSVLISRYKDHKSWKEIAEERGITSSRIYQIKEGALRRIRYPGRYEKIIMVSDDMRLLVKWAMEKFDTFNAND